MKTRSRVLFVSGLAICSSLAWAEDQAPSPPSPFSANVALTSNYMFRGQSQTNDGPAIQGGFDFKHGSGLYLGTWASNVDFNEPDTDANGNSLGRRAHMELDLYGGFSRELIKDLSFDVGLHGYTYPRAGSGRDFNYFEAYGGLTYKMFGVKYWHSPEYFGGSGTGDYVEGNVNVPLPLDFGLGLHVGHQWIEKNDVFGSPDWTDWGITVSKTLGGFNFSLGYVDSSLSEQDCFGGTTLCNAKAVFTISKTM